MMKNMNYWEQFTSSGSIKDYLNFREIGIQNENEAKMGNEADSIELSDDRPPTWIAGSDLQCKS